MCLYIDKEVHQKGSSHAPPLAIVAHRPLVVWKWLVGKNVGQRHKAPTPDASSARSPYLNHVWKFGVEEQSKAVLCGHRRDYRVHIGLHAYTAINQEQAARYAGFRPLGQLFPAVIPVGAKFFCGTPHEIATDRLTVYRDMKELLKAHGVDSLGYPVNRLKLFQGPSEEEINSYVP